MIVVTDIRSQLVRDEGRERKPYQDVDGWFTIGIGHCLGTKDKTEVPMSLWDGLSDPQIDGLFAEDLRHEDALIGLHLPWAATLPDAYLGVLRNMAFNMGCQRLLAFGTFLTLMKARSFEAAAQDLSETAVARQLPERYQRLCKQLETGEWQ